MPKFDPKVSSKRKVLHGDILSQLKAKKEAILGYGRKSGVSYSNNPNEEDTSDIEEDAKQKVTPNQLKDLEKYLDKLWAKVGIDVEFTRHFLDRVNDPRNREQISAAEIIKIFRDTFKRHGKKIAQLGPEAQAVMSDLRTDINVPFALELDGSGLELISKTVMRKKNFTTPNQKFKV